jgi:hypothetical protein
MALMFIAAFSTALKTVSDTSQADPSSINFYQNINFSVNLVILILIIVIASF